MKSQSDKVKAHVEDIKDKIEEDIKNLTSKDYFKNAERGVFTAPLKISGEIKDEIKECPNKWGCYNKYNEQDIINCI